MTYANKVCPKCDMTLPLTEFHKKRDSRDGFQNWCKQCLHVYHRHRRQAPAALPTVIAGCSAMLKLDGEDVLVKFATIDGQAVIVLPVTQSVLRKLYR